MKFISTAGHGYLEMTPNQLKVAMRKGYEPTSYSMFSKSRVLLEEDYDAYQYMKTMYPQDDLRIEKWKAIKSIYQENINKSKYMSTPSDLKTFEDMLDIYNQSNKSVGMIMTDWNGDKFAIVGRQKNGYIYRDEDNKTWLMPFNRITKIENAEIVTA
jgi:hypothetical protein